MWFFNLRSLYFNRERRLICIYLYIYNRILRLYWSNCCSLIKLRERWEILFMRVGICMWIML